MQLLSFLFRFSLVIIKMNEDFLFKQAGYKVGRKNWFGAAQSHPAQTSSLRKDEDYDANADV